MIRVVNFPFCNYSSVARMLKTSGYTFTDLDANSDLTSNDILILPGVGSFSEGMSYLEDNLFTDLIRNHAESGGKIIAICLGLQLLFSSSDESPGVVGLDLIEGKVVKIPTHSSFNIPHIGWDSINSTDTTPGFLNSFFDRSGLSHNDYYFVHSFYALPLQKKDSIATVSHPKQNLDVAFRKNNIYAFQFHPEKSGPSGYRLLQQVINQ